MRVPASGETILNVVGWPASSGYYTGVYLLVVEYYSKSIILDSSTAHHWKNSCFSKIPIFSYPPFRLV